MLAIARAYVATNSIRHLDKLIRHLDTHFSISNFRRHILGCIDADFCDQIGVGEIYNFHLRVSVMKQLLLAI